MTGKYFLTFLVLVIINFSLKAQKVKVVSNVNEFLMAISSDTHIKLKKGDYIITDAHDIKNPCITWEQIVLFGRGDEGSEPYFRKVKNMIIEGGDGVRILVRSRLLRVFVFDSCTNITLKNLQLGHTDGGACQGSIVCFYKCLNIEVNNCDLAAGGSEGMVIRSSNNFKFLNSTIKDCNYDISTIDQSENVLFQNDSLINSGGIKHPVMIFHCNNVKFNKCVIKGNINCKVTTYLFYIEKSKNIVMKNSVIQDNTTDYFTNYPDMETSKVKFSGNSFTDRH